LTSTFIDIIVFRADRRADRQSGVWWKRFAGLVDTLLGNITYILLGVIALRQGLLFAVQASIAGAIITNTLLIPGIAFIGGNQRNVNQTFSANDAQGYAKFLALILIALVLPAIAETSLPGQQIVETVSLTVAGGLLLMFLVYIMHDIFHYKYVVKAVDAVKEGLGPTSQSASVAQGEPKESLPERAQHVREDVLGKTLPSPFAAALLVVAVVATIFASLRLSDVTVALTNGTVPFEVGYLSFGTFKLTATFVGLVILPLIGSAAEHFNAVRSAVFPRQYGEDAKQHTAQDMVASTTGSAIQVALLAAPIFVIASYFFFSPANFFALLFTRLEIAVIALGAFIFYLITEDGLGTWLEGWIMFIAYLIFCVVAFLLP